jgi:cytidyltransferase-like protein
MSATVLVRGGFDDIRARDIRFLEEAAKIGRVTVRLLSDADILVMTGKSPKFPYAERAYFLESVRYVAEVDSDSDRSAERADLVVGRESDLAVDNRNFARDIGKPYRNIAERQLDGFPQVPKRASMPGRKVVVTGCYDWFHSGHVRFFEEASAYGVLTVCVGNDVCIRALKGEGHPLLSQDERRYVVGSIKYVADSVISKGSGWLDADAEIRMLRPDFYAVNDDGDKGGKREYCRNLGIEYIVLKRTPAPGLPSRSSTMLRGF